MREHVLGCWDEGDPVEEDHVCSTELSLEDVTFPGGVVARIRSQGYEVVE